jgi:hypothetical protein
VGAGGGRGFHTPGPRGILAHRGCKF